MVFFVEFPSPFWVHRLFSTLNVQRTGSLSKTPPVWQHSLLPPFPTCGVSSMPRSTTPAGYVCRWTIGKHGNWIIYAAASLVCFTFIGSRGLFFFLTVDEFSREYFIILNDCSKILVCLDKALDCHFVRVIFLKTHSFFLFIFSTLNKFLSIFG